MRNKHPKAFWRRSKFTAREKRLCFNKNTPKQAPNTDPQYDPDLDVLLGLDSNTPLHEVMNTNEQQRQHWAGIEKVLSQAVTLSADKELQEIWKSKELRKWIIAQVITNPDDGYRTWLTRAAQGYAERYEGTDNFEENTLRTINQKVSESVQKIVADMKGFVKIIKDHRDATGSGEPLPITGPEMNKVLSILNSLDDFDVIKSRLHALVAISNVIINAKEAGGRESILEVLEGNKARLGTKLHDKLKAALEKHLDDTTTSDFDDKKASMLKAIIANASLEFSDEDITTLKTAILNLDTEIATLDKKEEQMVDDVLQDHIRHMRWFGGDDRSAVIRSALRDDYKLDHYFLRQKLQILSPEIKTREIDTLITKMPSSYKVSDEVAKAAVTQYGLTIENIESMVAALEPQPNATQKADIDVALATGDVNVVAQAGMSYMLKILLEGGKQEFITNNKAVLDKAIIGPTFDIDAFLDQLVGAWDIEGTELDAYMKDDLDMDTPGVLAFNKTFRRLVLRSRLTKDVSDFMIKGDMQIYLSDVIGLSSVDNFEDADKLSKDATEKIVEMISENEGGKKRFDANRFIDVMSFTLLVKDPSISGKEAVAAARFAAAEKLARLEADGHITPDQGAKIIIESYDKSASKEVSSRYIIEGEDEVKKYLQTINVGDKAKEYHAKLNRQNLEDYQWHESTKEYLGEMLDSSKDVGASFIDVFKNFGTVFVSPNDAHKKLILQRDRLEGIRGALLSAIAVTQNSDDMLGNAIKELKQMKQATEDLKQPVSSTVAIDESLKQAKYLMEANTFIINALRRENLWDELPDIVRQTSLWVAMNQGDSPEEGLTKARDFIRDYNRSPNFLDICERARENYFTDPTEETLKKYIQSVENYQKVAHLPQPMVDEYISFINKFHAIAHTPWSPDQIIGSEVVAMNDDGEEVTGVVTQVRQQRTKPDNSNLSQVTLNVDGKKVVAWLNLNTYPQKYGNMVAEQHANLATAFMNAANEFGANLDPRDPRSTAYNSFYRTFIAELSPEDRKAFLQYRRKIETVTEIEGANVLDSMFHRHGLSIKPAAIIALATKRTTVEHNNQSMEVNLVNGSFSMDRWLNGGHRKFADEPLRLILQGPEGAKNALIQAYVNQEDVTYDSIGSTGALTKKTMTAAEAFKHVELIKRTLQMQSEQRQPSYEILDENELFTDPIEKGFRGMLESVQDMWAGDWVDKGKVIVGVAAAVWLAKHIWRKGSDPDASMFMKLSKFSMVGLPLLMVANSAYKQKTGRDILGEKLLFMSKDKRESALEQWRRRSLGYDEERYAVLGQPAGFAAMQQLMRKDSGVSIADLHEWKMGVKEGDGFNDYKNGAPPNLDVSAIQWRLGSQGTEEEAYKIAFLAYEAMCTDVAALHGIDSGDIRSRANWGSDYLFQEYAMASSYAGETADENGTSLQELLQDKNMGMMDAMLMEAQLAATNNNIDKNLTVVERMAAYAGIGKEKFQSLLGRAVVHGQVAVEKVQKNVPEYFESLKDWTGATYDEVAIWLRQKYPYAKDAVVDSFSSLFSAMNDLGISVVETAPFVLEFGYDRAVDGVEIGKRALGELKDFHDYLLTNPTLREWIKPFELSVARTFGFDLAELNDEQAKNQFNVELDAIASFYDGSNYPINDVLRPRNTISSMESYKRNASIVFLDDAGDPITAPQVKTQMEEWANGALKQNVFGAAVDNFENLKPAQQRYLLEIMQAHLFEAIAQESTGGELFDKKQEYDKDKSAKEQAIRTAELDVESKQNTVNSTEARLNDARKAESEKQELVDERASLLQRDQSLSTEHPTATPQRKTEINQLKRDIAGRIAAIATLMPALDAKIRSIAGLESSLRTQSGALETAKTALETLEEEFEQFIDTGLAAPEYRAKLKFSKLMPDPINHKILTPAYATAPRKPNLFKNVFDEDRKLFGYVNLNAILNKADIIAFKKTAESWKQNRLSYDPAYQADLKKPGSDPLVRASYERYLEQVALGEIFMRALMETPGGHVEEKERMLYLSVYEAKHLDQYLEERERLVTFAQFKEELFDSLEDTAKP